MGLRIADGELEKFSHEICVERVSWVIQRQIAQDLVTQLAVEADCRLIGDCGFQVHLLTAGVAEASFALLNESRGQPETACLRLDVQGQDAANLLDRLGYGETGDSTV